MLSEAPQPLKPPAVEGIADILEPEERTNEEIDDAAIIETFQEEGWLLTTKKQLDTWAKKGTAFIGVDYVLFAEVTPQAKTNDTFYFYKAISRGKKIEDLPDTSPVDMNAKLYVFRVEKRERKDILKAVDRAEARGENIPDTFDQEIVAPIYLTEMIFDEGKWVPRPLAGVSADEIDAVFSNLTQQPQDTQPYFVPLHNTTPPNFEPTKNRDFDPFAGDDKQR